MSRIGLKPIDIGPGVKVAVEPQLVRVEGPKGRLSQPLPAGIAAELAAGQLVLRRAREGKRPRALHGLARSLLANAVHGVTAGFSRTLEINGVGFSAVVKGRTVEFKLGYSHPVLFGVPEGIEIKVERSQVRVSGCDKQLVGQVAANIRRLRRPDVYKHKGIRYADEVLRKKAGKTGAK